MAHGFDKRLIFIMGKGGVGKSLVSAILAKAALALKKRVLLVQINTPDKIAGYLGCPAAASQIKEVLPNLFAVNIRPVEAMREYVLLQVKLELIYRLVFENRAVRYFLRAVPALNDLVVLGKIFYHVRQLNEETGGPLYDLVIVDAPPTGHGMFLLNLPRVMAGAIASGPIHKEAKSMLNALRDPAVTIIHLVTTPEEMPVQETAEMAARIGEEFKMPLGMLFINSVFPSLFEKEDGILIEQIRRLAPEDEKLKDIAGLIRMLLARRQLCERYLEELSRRVPMPSMEIPFQFNDSDGSSPVEAMTQKVLQAISET